MVNLGVQICALLKTSLGEAAIPRESPVAVSLFTAVLHHKRHADLKCEQMTAL